MLPKALQRFKKEEVNPLDLHAQHFEKVIGELQDCETIEDQITLFCSEMVLRKEDIEERKKMCQDVQAALSNYLPNCEVHIFGSSLTGFGTRDSDLDLLYEPYPDYWQEHGSMLYSKGITPNLQDIRDQLVDVGLLEHMVPQCQLMLVKKVFNYRKQVFGRTLFIPARVPLIKFTMRRSTVQCDLTCNHRLSLVNTRLFETYGRIDERVIPLMLILRSWAKFVGLIRHGVFTSYSFSILIVYYLQHVIPYVLPTVDALKALDAETEEARDSDYHFCSDTSRILPSSNTQSIAELIEGFFWFYVNYDFTQVVSICSDEVRERSSFDREEEGYSNFCTAPMAVQDPFDLHRNVTAFIKSEMITAFKKVTETVIRTFRANKSKNPDLPWGIGCLFVTEFKHQIALVDLPPHLHVPHRSFSTFMLTLSGKLKAEVSSSPQKRKEWIERVYWTLHGLLKYSLQMDVEVVNSSRLRWQSNHSVSQPRKNGPSSTVGEASGTRVPGNTDATASPKSLTKIKKESGTGVHREMVIAVRGTATVDVWTKRTIFQNGLLEKNFMAFTQREAVDREAQVSVAMRRNSEFHLPAPLNFLVQCIVWDDEQLLFFIRPYDRGQMVNFRDMAKFLKFFITEKLISFIDLPLGGSLEDVFC